MYLPAAHNDFIGAIVGEELGLLGVLGLLGCFAVVTWRGVRAALRAADVYGMLVAFGITLLIAMQVLVNFGVAMGVLPTKGLTLPFVSYGGSSLVLSLFAVGVLLSVSRTTSTSVLGDAPGSGEKPIGLVAKESAA
jgi:cell division protein FtsW